MHKWPIVHEKLHLDMSSITNDCGNVNQEHSEIPLHTPGKAIIKKAVTGVSKDVRKLKPSCTTTGNENGATTLKTAGSSLKV